MLIVVVVAKCAGVIFGGEQKTNEYYLKYFGCVCYHWFYQNHSLISMVELNSFLSIAPWNQLTLQVLSFDYLWEFNNKLVSKNNQDCFSTSCLWQQFSLFFSSWHTDKALKFSMHTISFLTMNKAHHGGLKYCIWPSPKAHLQTICGTPVCHDTEVESR